MPVKTLPVPQVPSISENEHPAVFAFDHQKRQQDFLSQLKAGLVLAAVITNNPSEQNHKTAFSKI